MNNMEKRGEMTIGTIVVIILAILVLVFVIYAFTTGTVPFLDSIKNFGGGQVNVQTVVQSCQIACTTQSAFDYCKKSRKVVFSKDKDDPKNDFYTCAELDEPGVGAGLDVCAIDCIGLDDSTNEEDADPAVAP
jgi:hypothetical protein|tara:strand:+ start:657 stop:1055 length:399 start_codon:yes stop_codon:yes gene_type:complete